MNSWVHKKIVILERKAREETHARKVKSVESTRKRKGGREILDVSESGKYRKGRK